MHVIYAGESIPADRPQGAIFLAGPTPRSSDVPSWRPEALERLRYLGCVAIVLVPEHRDGTWDTSPDGYLDQYTWERQGLDAADAIVFWIPRDHATMPGMTTNVEFGRYVTSGKVVLGAPEWATSIRYLETMLRHETSEVRYTDLDDTLVAALVKVEDRVG
jgi:hypothetical protein